MGTLRLYELPREVQKIIGGSGGILQPPRLVLRPCTVAKCSLVPRPLSEKTLLDISERGVGTRLSEV